MFIIRPTLGEDEVKKVIKDYYGYNGYDVLKYMIKQSDNLGGWRKILLCDECADKLTKWLEEEQYAGSQSQKRL